MAQLNFTITYPDDKESDLLTALRSHFGQKATFNEDGTPGPSEDYSALELKGMLQTHFVAHLRKIYVSWKKTQTNLDDLGAA